MLNVGDAPQRLLRAVRGLNLADLPDAEACCGFGGTFAVKNADTSAAMLADKMDRVRASGADVLCALDASCLMHIGGGLKDYMVNEFLTSDFAWFVKTNRKGLIYYDRIPFEMDMYVDFDTDNLKVKGRERYVFSYYDWRSVFGSFPTS